MHTGDAMPPRIADALLFFAPEHWGEVERFSHLCSGTYAFDERGQRALAGVKQHFEKAGIFRGLAATICPRLRIDRDQINAQGFTPATHSREMAAVIEASIVELYSCIDCTAKVLRAIYGQRSTGFRESTRSLFAKVDDIGGDFPDALKDAIRRADWFPRLLFLRDELREIQMFKIHAPIVIVAAAEAKRTLGMHLQAAARAAQNWRTLRVVSLNRPGSITVLPRTKTPVGWPLCAQPSRSVRLLSKIRRLEREAHLAEIKKGF